MPPILVHRSTMRVIDGMHRVRAAVLKGCREIDVAYFEGSEDEAFVLAVRENISHGLPLSLDDRKAAASRIISSHPRLSDRGIAAYTGLSGKTVAAIRRRARADAPESAPRIGTDGRVRPLTATEGRRRASELIEAHPHAPLREIAKAAQVSLGTAHDVRKRMRSGLDPVPPKVRAADGETLPPAPPRRTPERLKSLGAMVESLARDPSLRQTDHGRELLLRLRASVLTPEDWARLIAAVPAHCTEGVVEIARQCAETWNRFADELDGRPALPG
ncbi:ParB/RepB/Spo0J family partition protein [Actinomadura sp. DC4]|uniref:ParB/RepB/Spo0J family partition protein n=1 Tax=Actinomadura sp. DC4 TaxID=3055069 RepID=UPI0025AF173E|nr:ParB/RepB/Spo0J family partition protein [Actinomadura sp. DC4]MDN3354739.1 ParB/RepB/Spo0J family partition protein [Actinomadura sp. DC4]